MNDGVSPPTNRWSDTSTEAIDARYDWTDSSPSVAVIETAAMALDRDPQDLPALFLHLDPDALDALFTRGTGGFGDRDIQVSFSFAALEVTVTGAGDVAVEPNRDRP